MLDIAKLFVPFTRYPYQGRIVACPVCEAEGFRKVSGIDRRFKRLPTVMCLNCGLLYTNPMPTDEELGTYYAKYYRFDYQMAVGTPKPKHVAKRQVEVAHRFDALAGLLKPGAAVLDFGCGSGEFVSRMLDGGYDAHGFEPGEAYGSYAQARLGERIRIGRWQDVAYDGKFDLVTCFHVVEHLNTPVAALERIAGWLAPGGKAYIEVPDLAPQNGRKGFGFFHFAHVVGFNHFNLLLAAGRVGLTPVKTVSPTGVIFERGVGEAPEALAEKGRALTAAHFVGTSPGKQYLAYQRRKIAGRR